MAKTLEEIRKKLRELEGRRGSSNRDKTVYPHWDIPVGSSAIVRFAPDKNPENTFFWVDKRMFRFPFPGIKGHDENKAVIVQAPCIEMWTGANTCPVLNEVRPWWKDKSLEETASTYWAKHTYYLQGFIKNDPMKETEVPENPIRKFVVKPQIFGIIKASLLDPEMENSPVNYVNGRDFIISKTSKSNRNDYTTSKWSMKETALTDEMQAAIDKYGLVDLSSYLPKRPTDEQVAIIYDLFQSSLEGELYDPARFAQHFKPYGFDTGSGAAHTDDGEEEGSARASRPVVRPSSTPAAAPVSTPVAVVEEESPFVEEPKVEVKASPAPAAAATATTGKSPQEILAMLRNRNKA